MYCSNCGNKMEGEKKFCSDCGHNLKSEAPVRNQTSTSQQDSGDGKVFMVLGWAFAAMSLLIIPILFGAAAVIMGYLYKKHDDQHGTIIMIASIGTAIFGVLLGAITYPY